MIKEIWGNGKDVIIKYTKNVGGVWFAASAWMSNNSNLSDDWLRKNRYHKLDIKEFDI